MGDRRFGRRADTVRRRAALRTLERTIFEIAHEASTTVADAKSAYYRAQHAERRRELAQDNVTVASRVVDLARARQQAGAGSEVDVNLARAELQDVELALRAATLEAFAAGALAAVSSGNADAAIVYRSDVTNRRDVAIAFQVPAQSTSPIRYPAAVLRSSRDETSASVSVDLAAPDAFAQARAASPSDPDALTAEAGWLESKRRKKGTYSGSGLTLSSQSDRASQKTIQSSMWLSTNRLRSCRRTDEEGERCATDNQFE